MVLTVYVLIAWLTVTVFFLIPKGLTLVENIIAFFVFTILILNSFTILDLNLKLINHSYIPEKFICVWLQRNIITPLSLVIFVNFINYSKKILTKIIFTVIILFELSLVEYLSVWTGVKTYSGWNSYLTLALYAVEMIICSILAKGIKKIP